MQQLKASGAVNVLRYDGFGGLWGSPGVTGGPKGVPGWVLGCLGSKVRPSNGVEEKKRFLTSLPWGQGDSGELVVYFCRGL